MILFGWLQEVMNPPGRTATTMLPFWFGTLAGLAPWISIAFNIVGSKNVPRLRVRNRFLGGGALLQLRA
jgi:hypothetical protein